MRNAPIKVIYLMDFLGGSGGGTENQLLQLINRLDRGRFDPSLRVFRSTPFVEEKAFPFPVKVLNIPNLLRWNTLKQLLRLKDFIRESDTKIVHILFNDASIVAPFFCKMGGARVIVARRDMGFWYDWSNLALLRLSNLCIDRLVANSEAVRKNAIRKEGISSKKSLVIFNGHDRERFEAPPSSDFRGAIGIGRDDPIVGMVGRLTTIKRQSDLIRAYKIVQESHPHLHLVFIGDDREKSSLMELARTLGLLERVHFLGSVQETIPIIKHFTVGVHCSESEGLSNAVIEYMGCGKPVVCTRAGGNPELVEDGHNGYLVEVGDVEGLADRIIRVLSDPSLAREIGLRAQKRIFEEFSVDRMANAYMKLYEDLANGA
ncbi:MAG: glycosyltransferase [Acidobacteriia bacterium]|nr:glycosyltransferase [Terriglobia bacterium]